MKERELFIGLDVGSVSLNTVVMDQKGEILEEHYHRIKGRPLDTVDRVLDKMLCRVDVSTICGVYVTGIGGKRVADLLDGAFVNEVIAHAKAVRTLYPEVRTIIEMGGEDSKLILLKATGEKGLEIVDFSMNTLCAAGTGSFLDQQANRLKLAIEELGPLALKSKSPPRVAGRCSVFAKTDMIHLQQAAAPDYDIVAGLCYAVARNFKGNIGRGIKMLPPVSFQGGVAANLGVRKAFRDSLELEEDQFIIPRYFASMGAIGAVLIGLEDEGERPLFRLSLEKLRHYLRSDKAAPRSHEPLWLSPGNQADTPAPCVISDDSQGPVEAYIGVDVGSISTNVVVLDAQGNVLSKAYLMTAGRPLEAIKEGLRMAGQEVGQKVRILGAGTTGSGRYLTGDFIGADIVRNEITSQATAAANVDPKVDTIFEIGGQDSKYISLQDGAIVDFEMNKVCAAGTGSFLEEQAEKLGISIKEEFGRLALGARRPVWLGERCTVFMESDLVHHQQQGSRVDDLVAGLSYSIVENYLHKVVGDRKIGKHIFFQGGTAFNKGVVAAFEKVLGQPVTVPPHHDVTGAIGVALLAMRERTWEKSRFKGFELGHRPYEIVSFECKECPNHCEIRRVTVEGEKPLFYGSRCEKYDVDRTKKSLGDALPDLFLEREELLLGPEDDGLPPEAPVMGIPRILFFLELLPFWRMFFNRLGFRVMLSDKTNKKLIHAGVEMVVAETCFPIKVSHGHVLDLIQKGVKKIFIPSIIDFPREGHWEKSGYNCPYIQAFPYTIRSAIDFEAHGVEMLSPVFHLGPPRPAISEKELMDFGRTLGKSRLEARRAIAEAFRAQDEFYKSCRQRGREILNNLPESRPSMVLISRSYNGCDLGINLDLPRKLKNLGILAMPLDFLPLEEVERVAGMEHMYWKYGQRFLSAAQILKSHPRAFPIYISNFGCGPDSFIAHFFHDHLKGKPYLQLEFDEHSADAGVITRLEAFLDTLKNAEEKPRATTRTDPNVNLILRHKLQRTIYIPNMTFQAHALAGAFEACGVQAAIMPDSDERTLFWGRKLTTGRECYPCILTTGDMARQVMDTSFDRDSSAFFMPGGTGPCRFGQYNKFHRIVLDELGYPDVPILSPNQDEDMYAQLEIVGGDYARLAWQGIVAIDLLEKMLYETRPYEKNPGETHRVFMEWVLKIRETLRNRKDLIPVLRRARDAISRVAIDRSNHRPKIGIVGEIYIRTNTFSNENIILEIESLGGEVRLPPVSEWILYTNFTSRRNSIINRNYGNLVRALLNMLFQCKDERALEEIFHGALQDLEEPTIRETLRKAAPYVHDSFEGEAILSIGKSIDFIEKGVSGIINVMPFTCMPGTIVSAIMKRMRDNEDNIPVLHMAFDGQQQTNTRTRLEAFIYQAKQFNSRR